MRVVHATLSVAVMLYIYVAEVVLRPTSKVVSPAMVEAFSVICVADIVVGLVIRKRLLGPALEGIQRGDATALKGWQKANLVCMVLAVSVSLYGIVVRVMGGSPRVTWPFFILALVLMWVWRPQLNEAR